MASVSNSAKRERFQWLWTINSVKPVENKKNIGVPMREGDRLFVFFVSEFEVCFHRRGKKGFVNDTAWENARGIYNPRTGQIAGEIIDDSGDKTVFVISLDIDPETGEGCIHGRHFYNPESGDWGGTDGQFNN